MGSGNKAPEIPTTTTNMGLFGSAKTGASGSTFNPTDFQRDFTGLTETGALNAQKALNDRTIAQEAVDAMNNQYQMDFRNQLLNPALSKGWLRGSTAQDVANIANQDYLNRRYQLVNDEMARQQSLLASALQGYNNMFDIANAITNSSNALNNQIAKYNLDKYKLEQASKGGSGIGSTLGSLAPIAGAAIGTAIAPGIGTILGGQAGSAINPYLTRSDVM